MALDRVQFMRVPFVYVLCVLLLNSEFLIANEAPSLDGLSLFMSKTERDIIDKEPLPVELPVETVAPVEKAKPATKRPVIRKVTLQGAVIRPDQSAVLMLNTGTKILHGKNHLSEPDLRFVVQAYRQSVKLAPGETVQVRIGDGQ